MTVCHIEDTSVVIASPNNHVEQANLFYQHELGLVLLKACCYILHFSCKGICFTSVKTFHI